jgi:hypothetical protein
MATSWREVWSYLRVRYQLLVEEPTWIGMEWTFTYQNLVVTQRVKVEHAGDWVIVLAAVGKAAEVDAPGALRFNAKLMIGALAIAEDMCYLRAALPLDGISFPHLDRTIEVVAREAARLRDPNPAQPAKLFSVYED